VTPTLVRLCEHVRAVAALAAAARPTQVEEKGRHDFVTDMDRRIEDVLRAKLAPLFGVPVLGEESIADDETLPERAVVVDPLDGTGNWIAGIPFAAVSVALIEHGASTIAAVAAIGTETVYAAEAGAGAWRDGALMKLVETRPTPLVALSTGLLDAIDGSPAYRQLRGFGKLRNFGSQALQLCDVARGALSLNASMEARLWDDAAGRLIATEAGAYYKAFVRPEFAPLPVSHQRCLCAHPEIAGEVEKILIPYLDPDES